MRDPRVLNRREDAFRALGQHVNVGIKRPLSVGGLKARCGPASVDGDIQQVDDGAQLVVVVVGAVFGLVLLDVEARVVEVGCKSRDVEHRRGWFC